MRYKKTIILAAVFLVLLGTYLGTKFFIEKSAEEEINGEIEKISSIAEIRYENLRVGIFKPSIHLQGIHLTPRLWNEKIIINDLVFYKPKGQKGIPEDIHFKLDGIHLDPTHTGGYIRQYINDMRFPEFEAHLECAFSYDTENLILDIKRLKIGAGNLGEAELSLRLENLNLSNIQTLPKNIVFILTTISGASIASAEIKYKDDSLLNRIYELGARESKQPVDAYIKRITRPIERRIQRETDTQTKTILRAFRNFLISPGKINIFIKPKRPVSILSLYWAREPKKLVKLLGVNVDT